MESRGKGEIVFDFEEFKRIAGPIKDEFIFNRLNEAAVLIPGVDQFLKRLKSLRKRLVLATSTISRFVNPVLQHFKISDYFDIILTGESVSKGKPDPEIYLAAVDVLKLAPSDCIVFEDSQNGIKAALGAGIDVVKIEHS